MSPKHTLRLPPLEAVRAFEAVVRGGSTVAAAAELGLTHGAVSRRLKTLEDHLGTSLFGRGRGGRLTPTVAGAAFAEAASHALGLLAQAAAATDGRADRRPKIRVSTTASLAMLWLLPRLRRFQARYPACEVWVTETQGLVEPGPASGIDLALRSGRGPWPGVRAEPLMDDALVAVCAPALARGIAAPEDLARFVLLHDADPAAPWWRWTEAAGLGRPDWAERGPRLAGVALVLQAAGDGEGVALVPARLAARHLADDRLVTPLPVRVALGNQYWLVQPPRGAASAAARAFAAWLKAEASAGDGQ